MLEIRCEDKAPYKFCKSEPNLAQYFEGLAAGGKKHQVKATFNHWVTGCYAEAVCKQKLIDKVSQTISSADRASKTDFL